MTIFIIGSVEDTADELDYKRFNKQIIECKWIIDMAEGRMKESNHPAYLMYKDHIEWVKLYRDAFIAYREKDYPLCTLLSLRAEKIKPPFICPELCENFKRRLYEKDPAHYADWAHLGASAVNYYYVDGQWLRYENGKKSIVNKCGE